MRAVLQRITQGSVQVDQRLIADQIGPGLLIFLGIGKKDNEEIAIQLAKKISNLRIFLMKTEDEFIHSRCGRKIHRCVSIHFVRRYETRKSAILY